MTKELYIPQVPTVQPIKGLMPSETFVVKIPQCCSEGWDDCPHVSKEVKQKRKNIGL